MSFKDIILLNANDYFDTVFDVYVNIIIFILAISLCAAAFVINHHKTYTVNMIRQLLRRSATSEENAKTLGELRLSECKSLKRALSRDGQLTDIVKRVGERKLTYEEYVSLQKQKKLTKEKIDFENARFYISSEGLERAQKLEQKENPSIPRTILICVLILALAVCIALFMPEILSFIANHLSL